MSSIIFQVQSFIIVGILIYGFSLRKTNKFKHIKFMKFGIFWDLILVAQIELSRQAINTASKAMTNPVLLNIHISLAVSTVLLYFVMLYSGSKLNKGDERFRKWHKPIGYLTMTTRILTLITSNLIEVNA